MALGLALPCLLRPVGILKPFYGNVNSVSLGRVVFCLHSVYFSNFSYDLQKKNLIKNRWTFLFMYFVYKFKLARLKIVKSF